MKNKKPESIDKDIVKKAQRMHRNGVIINALISFLIVPVICWSINSMFNMPMLIYYVCFTMICIFVSAATILQITDNRLERYVKKQVSLYNEGTERAKKRNKKIYGQKKPNKIS